MNHFFKVITLTTVLISCGQGRETDTEVLSAVQCIDDLVWSNRKRGRSYFL